VNEFLLVGTRPPASAELSLTAAAGSLAAGATWQRWLRRWGLLRSFALPREPGAALRACLVVRASGDGAAEMLAAGWARVTGYRVQVMPLADAGGGPRP
jgi:hypothetical protein